MVQHAGGEPDMPLGSTYLLRMNRRGTSTPLLIAGYWRRLDTLAVVPSDAELTREWEAACAPPPVLDQPRWLADLTAARPDLMRQHHGSVRDPAWQALVVRPRYRPELLADPTLTYEDLVAREYTPADRAEDAAWAQSLRDAQAASTPTANVAPGGYDLLSYASYRVGPPMRPASDTILDYKVFFEIADPPRTLTPDAYAAFTARLDAAGFQGDSKIDLRPGQTRFQYNDVIVHAPSIAMALCAEAVGIAAFSPRVEHVARGVDVRVDGKPTDWHHFLLTGRFGELPAVVRDFVGYTPPIATLAACPRGG